MWNKRNLAIGIMFIVFALFCGVSLIRGERTSYYITGVAVFAIVGVAFLKRGKQ